MSRPSGSGLVIVGGGLAGAAAACMVAQAGRQVTVLERDRAPQHKVCGEFISAEAQGYLHDLGVEPFALGARRIHTVSLILGEQCVDVLLPFSGSSLSRKVLDDALLLRAAALGAVVRRGTAVREIETRGRIRLQVANADPLSADALFLASGKHDLPGFRRTATRSTGFLVGFKNYYALDEAQRSAMDGRVELILLKHGYAGLQQIEGGWVNVCLLVEQEYFHATGASWPRLLQHLLDESPHLKARLVNARPMIEKPLAIARVPYGFLYRPTPADPSGLYRLGDQMAVIDSFTGDGMSIALHSARAAASCYLAGGTAVEYHRRMVRDVAQQVRLAAVLYRCCSAPLGRHAWFLLCRLWPGLLRIAARQTRVAPQAVTRTRTAGYAVG